MMILTGGSGFLDFFNILDIVIVLIFAISIFIGYKKGLIKTVFNLLSIVIALFLANKLYPVVSVVLRERTGLFETIKANVINALNLENVVMEQSIRAQEELIQNLPIPDFLINTLTQNNNAEVYKILNVSSIEEYIGGYIANVFINIISAVIVFFLVFIIMKLITKALDIVSKLPVINKFDKTGGIVAGIFTGLIYSWIGLIIYTILFLRPGSDSMVLLNSSFLALFLFENNFLTYAIVQLFA